ncbi:MAG: hypothetical protein ACT4QB_15350 [Gammaproteobacteria bacterium]
MPNISGNAYALTVLSPIKNGCVGEIAYADEVQDRLQSLGVCEDSPLAKVPQTYLARFFILDDVFYESSPGCDPFCNLLDILSIFEDRFRLLTLPREDHLRSRYLVFSSNFHGDLESYLRGMWSAISADIKRIWEHCVAFSEVQDAEGFIAYIKRCQLTANLFFMGSTDDSLDEQLKALYLKQQFAKFAVSHQGLGAAELQEAFRVFIERVQPSHLAAPTWRPGQAIP